MQSMLDTYIAGTEGLLALRTVGELSQAFEAETSGALADVWSKLSDEERAAIDPVLIENLKAKWS